jgi:hypothetical protein
MHTTTMRPLAKQLAAVMASTDGVPHVMRQSSVLYLVTPTGDVWRICDSDDEARVTRMAATHDSNVSTRIFIGSGPHAVVRAYRFLENEDRSVSAERLYEQLGESRASV